MISGNVVAVIFVFLLCPETGGKTLEHVDYLFVRGGFAGLRKDFEVTQEDMEDAFELKNKTTTERIERTAKFQ